MVGDTLKVAVDGGQRGAQLVGEVGQQPLALLFGGLQGFGHGVEGTAEHGQLVAGAALGHSGGVAAVGDALGGAGQRADRAYDPPCQKGAHPDRGEQRDHGASAQGHQHRNGQAFVEVAGGVGGDGAKRHAGVVVEQARRHGQRHHGQGQAARHDHQHLGCQQLGAEAAAQPPAQGAHVPGPMR